MTDSSEKFYLKWTDFQTNIVSFYQHLRKNHDFSDITLVCDDGQQIEGHRIILSASSPFFNTVLKGNKHPHPMMYIRGWKAKNLSAIMDFIYNGEANIFQEDLDAFLTLAEDLQLKGLEKLEDEGIDAHELPLKKEPIIKQQQVLQTEVKGSLRVKKNNINAIDGGKLFVPADASDEDVRIKLDSLMQRVDDQERVWKCTVCGKESKGYHARSNLRGHIETHMEGLLYTCKECGKICR